MDKCYYLPIPEGKLQASVAFPMKASDDDNGVTVGREQTSEAAKSNMGRLVNSDGLDIVTDEIEVDRKHYKAFFLNGASLIRKISEENGGVHITFPRGKSCSKLVLLTGAKRDVTTAKFAIMEAVADLHSHVEIQCIIPHEHFGDVIGAKGANVRALSQEYSVDIQFPKPPFNEASAIEGTHDPRDVILLSGKEENCLMVKQALLDLIHVVTTLDVPYRLHGWIIGRRGEKVRSICDKYRVRIDVTGHEPNKDRIYLRGPPRKCEQAKEAILNRVEELQIKAQGTGLLNSRASALEDITDEVEMDYRLHSRLTGPKGRAMAGRVMYEHNVVLHLPQDNATNKITIIGQEECVEAAKLHLILEEQKLLMDHLEAQGFRKKAAEFRYT